VLAPPRQYAFGDLKDLNDKVNAKIKKILWKISRPFRRHFKECK
jgi:hypothetical protein